MRIGSLKILQRSNFSMTFVYVQYVVVGPDEKTYMSISYLRAEICPVSCRNILLTYDKPTASALCRKFCTIEKYRCLSRPLVRPLANCYKKETFPALIVLNTSIFSVGHDHMLTINIASASLSRCKPVSCWIWQIWLFMWKRPIWNEMVTFFNFETKDKFSL